MHLRDAHRLILLGDGHIFGGSAAPWLQLKLVNIDWTVFDMTYQKNT